jgi:hypothetical protein
MNKPSLQMKKKCLTVTMSLMFLLPFSIHAQRKEGALGTTKVTKKWIALSKKNENIVPALKVQSDGEIGVPIINKRLNMLLIKSNNKKILYLTQREKVEYGTEEKVKDLKKFELDNKSNIHTSGNSNVFAATMTWSGKSGYAYATSHGHPRNTGPSPADVFWAVPYSLEIPKEDRELLLSHFQTATLTPGAIYVITVKNDSIWREKSSGYFKNQMAHELEFQNNAYEYMKEYNCKETSIASEYSILKMYGDAIHFYKAFDYDNPKTELLIIDSYLHKSGMKSKLLTLEKK